MSSSSVAVSNAAAWAAAPARDGRRVQRRASSTSALPRSTFGARLSLRRPQHQYHQQQPLSILHIPCGGAAAAARGYAVRATAVDEGAAESPNQDDDDGSAAAKPSSGGVPFVLANAAPFAAAAAMATEKEESSTASSEPLEPFVPTPELLRFCEPVEADADSSGASPKKLKIAVLLSGGVDSSVALTLLQAAGHECVAFYLQIWFQEDFRNYWDQCPWEDDLVVARGVCDVLGVPLEVVPLTNHYWDLVVGPYKLCVELQKLPATCSTKAVQVESSLPIPRKRPVTQPLSL
jgi:hypothetical protein